MKISKKHAAAIVDGILEDLTDRRGLRHEWDAIDDDIKHEIIQEWVRIVVATEDPPAPTPSRG